MSLLDDIFNELLAKIRSPEALNPAHSDPVFYFVYPVERMLELKRCLPRWTTKLREAGFQAVRISFAEIMWRLIDQSGRWETWLELESDADPDQLNDAMRDVLRRGDALVREVRRIIEAAPADAVILLTETELLHPYFRTRTIESSLHDKVTVPTVIFYPGGRSGQYGLRFLGFYPVDGNYRSTLVGGC